MELKDAVVLITGGTSGIGAAIATILQERGACVVICSMSIAQSEPEKGRFKVDVREVAEVKACLDDVMRLHGRIDLLVNNAGTIHPIEPIEKITEEEFQAVIRTNVDGVFHFLREVLPVMKTQKSGTIVTIASRAGTRIHPGLSAYSASKAAALGLMRGMARELTESGDPIRSFTISPGGVRTKMREDLFGKEDSDKQQSPEIIAQVLLDALENIMDVPNGADVKISRGEVQGIDLLD